MKAINILFISLISAITVLGQEKCPGDVLEEKNNIKAKNIFSSETENEKISGSSYVCKLSSMSDERFNALCDRFEYNPNFENAKNSNPDLSIYVMYAKNFKGETNMFCIDLDCKTTLAKPFKWSQVESKGKPATNFKCEDNIIASIKSYNSMHPGKSLEDIREHQRMIEEVFQCPIGSGDTSNLDKNKKQPSIENRISHVEENLSKKVEYVEGVLRNNKNLSDDVRQQFESYRDVAKKYSSEAKKKHNETKEEMKKNEVDKCDECRKEITESIKKLEKKESEMAEILKELKKYL